jgi:hypothetical protein
LNPPAPPKCIAEALYSVFVVDDIVDDECVTEQAQAVWDALLAKYGWGWLPTPPGHPRAYQLGTIEAGLGGDPQDAPHA